MFVCLLSSITPREGSLYPLPATLRVLNLCRKLRFIDSGRPMKSIAHQIKPFPFSFQYAPPPIDIHFHELNIAKNDGHQVLEHDFIG